MAPTFRLLLMFACLVFASLSVGAETQAEWRKTIAKEISGTGTDGQRRHVADLLGFLVEVSQRPQQLTIANVAALEGSDYEAPFCVTRPDGIRRCMYSYTSSAFFARLNNLDTFSLNDESDSGARVSIELIPDTVCLQHRTVSKLWGVPPVERPMPLVDFFPGSDEAEDTSRFTMERYNNIVPTRPYIFAQTTSDRGCVTRLELSVLPP